MRFFDDEIKQNEVVIYQAKKSNIAVFLNILCGVSLIYISYIGLSTQFKEIIGKIKEDWLFIFGGIFFICALINMIYLTFDGLFSDIVITDQRILIKKIFRSYLLNKEEINEIVPIGPFFCRYLSVNLLNRKSIQINNLTQKSYRDFIHSYNSIE